MAFTVRYSHFYGNHLEVSFNLLRANGFDWQSTRDYSGWLAVTAALDFLTTFGVER